MALWGPILSRGRAPERPTKNSFLLHVVNIAGPCCPGQCDLGARTDHSAAVLDSRQQRRVPLLAPPRVAAALRDVRSLAGPSRRAQNLNPVVSVLHTIAPGCLTSERWTPNGATATLNIDVPRDLVSQCHDEFWFR